MQLPKGPVPLYPFPNGTILRTIPDSGYQMVVGRVGSQLFTQPVNSFNIGEKGTLSSSNGETAEVVSEPKTGRLTRFA